MVINQRAVAIPAIFVKDNMINEKDYYTAPSDEIFEDIKQAAIKIWRTYDDTYGYATEKVNRIDNLKNIQDNYAAIVAMFDYSNQQKLLAVIDREDAKILIEKLIS